MVDVSRLRKGIKPFSLERVRAGKAIGEASQFPADLLNRILIFVDPGTSKLVTALIGRFVVGDDFGVTFEGIVREWTAGQRRSQCGTDCAIVGGKQLSEDEIQRLVYTPASDDDDDAKKMRSALRSFDANVRHDAERAKMDSLAVKIADGRSNDHKEQRRWRAQLTQRFDSLLCEGLLDVAVALHRRYKYELPLDEEHGVDSDYERLVREHVAARLIIFCGAGKKWTDFLFFIFLINTLNFVGGYSGKSKHGGHGMSAKGVAKLLSALAPVITVNEFYSSQKCPRCLHKLKRTNSGSHRGRVCVNESCAMSNGDAISKDVTACFCLALIVAHHFSSGGKRHPAFVWVKPSTASDPNQNY